MRKKALWLLGMAIGIFLLASCTTQSSGQPTTSIQGTLVDPCGQPVPYKTVSVEGKIAVTDADGHFSFSNVSVPYDLAVVNALFLSRGLVPDRMSGPTVLILQGLSNTEPTVTVFPLEGSRCLRKTLTGTLTPDKENGEFGIASLAGTLVSSYIWDYTTGADEFNFRYQVSPDQVGKELPLFAAGWSLDSEGNADTYYGALKTELAVPTGDTSSQDLELNANVTTNSLEVSVTGSTFVRPYSLYHRLALDGIDTGIETARVDLTESAGPAVVKSLEYLGVTSLVVAMGTYGEGMGIKSVNPEDLSSIHGLVWTWKQVEPGAGTVSLALPEPVIPVIPPPGAVIEKNASFAWSGPEGTIYDSQFLLERGDGEPIRVEVLTASEGLRLPDLSSVGLSYEGFYGLYWVLSGVRLPGVATVDDLLPEFPALLGGTGFLGEEGSRFYVEAGEYTFPDAPGWW